MELFNNYKKIVYISLLSIVIVFSFNYSINTAKAAFNKQINYQGKLFNSSNSAVTDGNYNIRYNLYTSSSGGSPIWTETLCYSADGGATCSGSGTDSRVAVTSGLFSTLLGNVSSLDSVNFNQTLYLGVEIGGTGSTPSWDGEMTPRKKLGAVPASFEADRLDGISSEQFLRADANNSTTTSSTFFNLTQNGAGKIAEFFGQGATAVMSVLSNGNVGIGTSTPGQMLSVAGDILGNKIIGSNFTATSSSASVLPYASSTAISASTICFTGDICRTFWPSGSGGAAGSWSTTTSQVGGQFINYSNNNTDIVAIGSNSSSTAAFWFDPNTTTGYVSGKLGIGSSTPFGQLSVNPNGITGPAFVIGSSTATSFVVSNSGNVGIGTTSPYNVFTIRDTLNTTFPVALSTFNNIHNGSILIGSDTSRQIGFNLPGTSGSTLPGDNWAVFRFNGPSNKVYIGDSGTNAYLQSLHTLNLGVVSGVSTSSLPQMSILSGGNVGIGSTSPWARLSVHADSTAPATALFAVASSTSNSTTTVLVLTNSGNLGIGTTSPGQSVSVSGDILGNNIIGSRFNATSSVASVFPYASSTAQTISGTLYLSNLNGPLQANNGVVSATTSVGVLYGGTGLTSYTPGDLLYASGASTLAGTSTANLKASLALNNVENTALSTWAGSSNITTLGTITSGTWNGNTIGVANGGTGATTYGQGWIYSNGGTGALSASTSPTVAYLVATSSIASILPYASTTAISTGNAWFTGNVGIGTTTPRFLLDVESTAGTQARLIGDGTSGAGLVVSRSQTPTASGDRLGGLFFGMPNGSSNFNAAAINAYASGAWTTGSDIGAYLTFETTASGSTSRIERLRVDNNGNIGIGSTTPYSILSISNSRNTAGNTPLLTIASTTNGTATSTFLTVLANGNTGFGTTSPGQSVSVSGDILGNNIIGSRFNATSSVASVFPYASTTAISANTICFTGDTCRTFWPTGSASTGTWSTTTSQVGGQFINYSNNNTDIVAIGSNSSSTAAFWFDPNITTGYISGKLGIGTTSPGQRLSVSGDILGNIIIGSSFNATSSVASVFPYASTTAISAGTICLTGDSCRTTWPTGGGSAFPFTPSIFGSTNSNSTSTLIGFTAGIYSLASSTIGDGTQTGGLTISGGATTTLNAYFGSNIGIGTTTPGQRLSVAGNILGNEIIGSRFNATSSVASVFPYASTTAISASGSAYFATSGGLVGIGTTTPAGVLEVVKNATNALIYSTVYSASAQGFQAGIVGRKAAGSSASPLPTLTDSNLLALSGRGYLGTDFSSTANGLITIRTQEQFSSTNMGTGITFETTANGTINRVEVARITGEGNLVLGTTTQNGRIVAVATSSVTNLDLLSLQSPTPLGLATSTVFLVNAYGNLGIGTTSPGQSVSVSGDILGNNIIGSRFNATSSVASVFPYASSTAQTISGTLYLDNLNGPLQANNGVVSATTSIGVVYGGTGLTSYTPGDLLYASGASTLAGTSTANLKASLALNNVENTALSTWAGSSNITTLGTITSGTWNGNTIGVANGGTGATTYGQGWIYSNGGTGALSASTSPTVAYLVATSSTIASIFPFASTTAITASSSIGVGTTTVTHTLDIVDTLNSSFPVSLYTYDGTRSGDIMIGTAASRQIGFNTASATGANSSSDGWVQFRFNAAANKIGLGDTGTEAWLQSFHKLNFSVGSVTNASTTPNMTLTSTGLGIGSTTPYSILSISNSRNTAGNTPLLTIASTTNGTATSTFLTVLANGNTGFGTTSPGQMISVTGDILGNNIIGSYFNATSTTSSVFPYASTTAISAGTICLTGDTCRTTWPTSGGSAFPFTPTTFGATNANSTSTLIGFTAGIYSLASSTIGSGTQAGGLTISGGATTTGNAYFGGSVGIGAIPSWNLQVSGSRPMFALSDTSASANFKHWTISSQGGNMYFATSSDALATSTLSALTINSNGYVGIGSTTPYANLGVTGLIAGSRFNADDASATSTLQGGLSVAGSQLNVDFSTGITSISSLETGPMTFDTDAGMVTWTDLNLSSAANNSIQGYSAMLNGSTTIMVYGVSAGNGWLQNDYPRVAIGSSTAPSSKLTVYGNGTGTNGIFEIANSASTTLYKMFDNGIAGMATTSPWATFAINPLAGVASNQFVIGSSTATNFVVNNSGLVGLATTSPWRTLSVVGTAAFNGLTSTATGNAVCITAGKELTDSGGASCTPSSIRFKENVNILPEGYALNELAKLGVVSFDYINKDPFETNHSYGMIAEEVEKIDKNLVDYGYDGKPVSLHFEKITGLLVQAVQEQQKQINDLKLASSSLNTLSVNSTNINTSSNTNLVPVSMTEEQVRAIASSTVMTIVTSELRDAYNLDLIASSTEAKLVSSNSFIEKITLAIKNYAKSSSDWAFDKLTVKTGLYEEITANKTTTKELCIEDVCVSKNELKALLDNAHINTIVNTSTNINNNNNSTNSSSTTINNINTETSSSTENQSNQVQTSASSTSTQNNTISEVQTNVQINQNTNSSSQSTDVNTQTNTQSQNSENTPSSNEQTNSSNQSTETTTTTTSNTTTSAATSASEGTTSSSSDSGSVTN